MSGPASLPSRGGSFVREGGVLRPAAAPVSKTNVKTVSDTVPAPKPTVERALKGASKE